MVKKKSDTSQIWVSELWLLLETSERFGSASEVCRYQEPVLIQNWFSWFVFSSFFRDM